MVRAETAFGPGSKYNSEYLLVHKARMDQEARQDLRRYGYDLALALAAFYSDEPNEIVRLATIGMNHFNTAYRGYILRLLTENVDYSFSTYFLLYIRGHMHQALNRPIEFEEDDFEDAD